MNYNQESLRNALAAEYVLGTLRGGARRRYQQLIMTSQSTAETTWLWEQYLNGMGEFVPPVEPSDIVWQTIQQKLGFVERPSNVTPLQNERSPKNSKWRGPALFAFAASLLIAVIWTSVQPVLSPPVTHIAVVNDADTNPLWLIEISDQQLRVRSTDQVIAQADKDFELWIVPANGGAPISLGVLPKDGELKAPAAESLRSVPIMVLAVSLEPLGGSPNGQPTEVLYTTNLITV
ncbi:anti-sigma factor [Alteromonas oceanisediminis]|uniref:anti-sigma factor n=1 Tax=Alteromonas oceanisediminis TaxID=2836180 RepID=UPI001BDB0E57|nr:anti-sigma factor [Alteromonas oceanisediminis]MBT0585411.1 anti-sigma factor [Alteromonas oceanisediminis]